MACQSYLRSVFPEHLRWQQHWNVTHKSIHFSATFVYMMARWKRDLAPENSLVGDNSNLKSLLMREKFQIEENRKIKEKQTEKIINNELLDS